MARRDVSREDHPGFKFPEVGKISSDIFEKVIFPRLGRPDPAVLVGPKHGVDVGVVEVAPGTVMAVTSDPVFIVPAYGWERAAWFAVNILASDAATSGLPPRWMAIDLNLPISMMEEDFTVLWSAIHRECAKLGISIIAGHTARYHGTDFPMVGGAVVMSLGPSDAYVTPTMARPGDVVVVTKGAAIEATAIFGASFPRAVADAVGHRCQQQAEELFWSMSVVDDCLLAASVGVRENGVTAMHDATECGVFGGLVEVAQASGCGMRVVKERIPVLPEVEAVCRAFGMDPYTAISEGTLILACVAEKADLIMRTLRQKGIVAEAVGEMTESGDPVVLTSDGVDHALEHPRVDPFWEAFARTAAR